VSSPGHEFWARLAELDAEIERQPAHVRRALGARWAESGRGEHASVASFGRFALALLAAAAPPELVEAAHRAALDEIHHARICFALASRYLGEALGPGPLAVTGDMLGPFDLEALARATVEEGCVGETLAALEAEAHRSAAPSAVIQAAWCIIAADEARHAELAWSFVRWAIGTGGEPVRAAVSEAFERALQDVASEPALESALGEELAASGFLDGRARQQLRLHAVQQVIRPALTELLG